MAVFRLRRVGERTREGNDLWLEMKESGVINKAALVYGQMNEPPEPAPVSPLTASPWRSTSATTKAGTCCSSSTTFSVSPRPTQRYRPCSDVLPSAVGYQPTLATDLGELEERITTTHKGSITSVQAIYVPADDLTDPAPATTFAHLDATTVLSRQIAELGIYPAVDPLDSTSRHSGSSASWRTEHYEVARQVE